MTDPKATTKTAPTIRHYRPNFHGAWAMFEHPQDRKCEHCFEKEPERPKPTIPTTPTSAPSMKPRRTFKRDDPRDATRPGYDARRDPDAIITKEDGIETVSFKDPKPEGVTLEGLDEAIEDATRANDEADGLTKPD